MKRIEMDGKKYYRLTVINLDHSTRQFKNGKIIGMIHYYKCLCDCGKLVVEVKAR